MTDRKEIASKWMAHNLSGDQSILIHDLCNRAFNAGYDAAMEELAKIKKDNSKLKTDNLNLRLIYLKLQRDLDRDEHVDGFWMKDLFPEAQELEQLQEQLKDCEWVLNEISTYADCDDVNGEAGNIARQFLAKIKKEE